MLVLTRNVLARARPALASAALVLALPFMLPAPAMAQTGGYSTGYGQPRAYDTRPPVEEQRYGGAPRTVPDYEKDDAPQGYDTGTYDDAGTYDRRPDDYSGGNRGATGTSGYGEPQYGDRAPQSGERLPWAPAPRTDYGYSYGGGGTYGAQPGLKDEPGAYRNRDQQEAGGYARAPQRSPYRIDDNAAGYGTDEDAHVARRTYDHGRQGAQGIEGAEGDYRRQRGYDAGKGYVAAPGPGEPYYPADQYRDPRYGRYDGHGARGHGPVPPESVPGGSYGYDDGTYDSDEIAAAGHRFFGKITTGLAKVIEYVFQRAGRPNGYILGEEAGGAFVAGLRYGEGTLYTKNAGEHVVYWQGPSIGYDFGAEGSKTMILVYNLRDPSEIYDVFGGVDGSAYLVGGVGVTFQKQGHLTLAPIRSGVGVRLGANIGYLRYTRRPTWNPF